MKNAADIDRFSMKFAIGEDGCWNWMAARARNGYGVFTYRGKWCLAHRAAYELAVGRIPAGLTLDHLCRNRACVNPDHLEPVTGRENVLRGIGPSAENARRTHCKAGHPLTSRRRCPICLREWARQKRHDPTWWDARKAYQREWQTRKREERSYA